MILAPADNLAADADDLSLMGIVVVGQIAVMLFMVGCRHQQLDIAAGDLRGRIYEQSFARLIVNLDHSAGVDDDDAIHRRRDQGAKQLVVVQSGNIPISRNHGLPGSVMNRPPI